MKLKRAVLVKALLIWACLILLKQQGQAQIADSDKLAKRISFLAQKFFLDLPAGAAYAPRRFSTCSASLPYQIFRLLISSAF